MTERPPLPHEPRLVRAELQRRIYELLPALGINDQPRDGIVTPLNPRRGDRHPGSFVIWVSGDAVGGWRDYAMPADCAGDVFDLIGYLGRLDAWIDAYWWALEFLGWGRGTVRSASDAALDAQRVAADRLVAERKAQSEADGRAKKALGTWLHCEKDFVMSPVWTYLTLARGLPLQDLPRLPGAIRYHPALQHTDQATGEVTEWPAMVCAMSRWNDGEVRCAHRTWLAPNGLGKAPVTPAKKMLGRAQGCAIRVWKGASNLTPEAAARGGVAEPLVITEGIEDALTAAIASPHMRIWAAGSLAGMGGLGWPDCASAVVLVADNDWETPEAVKAFEGVEAKWRAMAQGRPLKVVRAERGKDLNDWAREDRARDGASGAG